MGCIGEIDVELLWESWSELSDSAVAFRLEYSEELDEDDESDSSDDEFELRMARYR
jgi:hypothetical protein